MLSSKQKRRLEAILQLPALPLSFTHLKCENLHANYLLTKQHAVETAALFIASIRIPKKHNTDKHSNAKKHKSTEPENSICCHDNAPGSVATNNGIHHVTSSVIYTNEQRFCGRECCQRFFMQRPDCARPRQLPCSSLPVYARSGCLQ